MKLILADIHEPLTLAWTKFFSECGNVSVHHGSIFELDCDAIVSPANSFGFMDGGLDLLISRYLGWHVQERLQEIIKTKYHGELLVGQAEIVETSHEKIPYLISAPTMRVPKKIIKTVNAFLATRAILLLVKYGKMPDGKAISDIVQTIAIPGLGTGVGELPPSICARQMRMAYDEIVLGKYAFPNSWREAQAGHVFLGG